MERGPSRRARRRPCRQPVAKGGGASPRIVGSNLKLRKEKKMGRARRGASTHLDRLGVGAGRLEEVTGAKEAVALILERGELVREGGDVLGGHHRSARRGFAALRTQLAPFRTNCRDQTDQVVPGSFRVQKKKRKCLVILGLKVTRKTVSVGDSKEAKSAASRARGVEVSPRVSAIKMIRGVPRPVTDDVPAQGTHRAREAR